MINAIDVKNLSKRYDKNKELALGKASFSVKPGDWHGFIGPNGAGKTTTIKTLIGALKPTSGSASIFGYPAGTVESKKQFGYVPEKTVFTKGRFETTYSYLMDIALMNGHSLKSARKAIQKVSNELDIDKGYLRRNPYTFSSGEKRRVLVAQALLGDPKILILDEPTANLDPDARKFVLELLKNLSDKREITIFISSHVLTELQKYVTGWTILNRGTVLESRSLVNQESNTMSKYQIICDDLLEQKQYLFSKGYKNARLSPSKTSINLIVKNNIKEKMKLQQVVLNSPFQIDFFGEKEVDLEERYESLIVG